MRKLENYDKKCNKIHAYICLFSLILFYLPTKNKILSDFSKTIWLLPHVLLMTSLLSNSHIALATMTTRKCLSLQVGAVTTNLI